MSRRYKGAILSSTAATTSSSSASGVWTPQQQMQAAADYNWPGVTSPFTGLTLTLNSTSVSSASRHLPPASVSTYTSDGSVLPTGTIYANGYFYFTLFAGLYTVVMKGAEGSGNQHGYGATLNATLVCTATTRMVAIIGQAGSGSYSAGGMSALATTASGADTYVGATPILVAGGGGGGYGSLGAESDAGGTSWPSTTRRNNNPTECPTYGGGVYDAGAPFTSGAHQVSTYSCTVNSEAAVAFTAGATGGIQDACGTDKGGFGGGGGSCPGGGGGFYGGFAGGNSPSATGGGGGTSYRATSGTVYVSAWSDGALNGSDRTSNPGTAFGYLSITAI